MTALHAWVHTLHLSAVGESYRTIQHNTADACRVFLLASRRSYLEPTLQITGALLSTPLTSHRWPSPLTAVTVRVN